MHLALEPPQLSLKCKKGVIMNKIYSIFNLTEWINYLIHEIILANVAIKFSGNKNWVAKTTGLTSDEASYDHVLSSVFVV